MRLGALEAGGTKMVCAIGDEQGNIMERVTFPTETPAETMPSIIEFFKKNEVEAVGVGCFGPIDLNRESKTYGYITSTPKLAWQYFDICGTLSQALEVPIGFDTDVNGSCLGEITYGAARGCNSAVYITFGTGVGMGICNEGKLIHGMMHPEAGHMMIAKHKDDTFEGVCPFHKGCVEGLCAGNSIGARYGMKAFDIPKDDIAWEYTAYYMAQTVVNLILTVSPQKIILGGGVMKQEHLYPMIRKNVKEVLNGYVQAKELENLEEYIVVPGCGDDQGILGALMLGYQEWQRNNDCGL